MLEVCFSDAVKGALLMAQHCGGRRPGGAVSVITDRRGPLASLAKLREIRRYRKRQAALQRQAVPLGGRREDVVGLSFGLSEGDIRAPIAAGDCPRRAYLWEQFSFDRYGEREDLGASFRKFWDGALADLRKLEGCPQAVRVWLDDTPDARCGLLFLAERLAPADSDVHVVELPKRVAQGAHEAVEYRGWGEVEPQLFGTFLDRERALTGAELDSLAGRWRRLQEENAPLRVVRDGAIVSADIDYYDDRIRSCFPEAPCKVAQIIGEALGRQKILTGDVFVAQRVRHFLETGELVVVGSGETDFYRTTVARAR